MRRVSNFCFLTNPSLVLLFLENMPPAFFHHFVASFHIFQRQGMLAVSRCRPAPWLYLSNSRLLVYHYLPQHLPLYAILLVEFLLRLNRVPKYYTLILVYR